MKGIGIFAATCIALTVAPLGAEETVDLDLVTRIRDEGFRHSQVMQIADHLTNHIGSRVTGSPSMLRANEWTRDQLASMGLQNARLEAFDFGRGWSWSHCTLQLLGDTPTSLHAIPQAWTPGTDGPVEGTLIHMEAEKIEDLEEYRGKVGGKIVLLSEIRKVEPAGTPPFRRLSEEDLRERARFDIPEMEEGESEWIRSYRKRLPFRRALDAFLVQEGGLAILEVGSRDFGVLRVPRGGEPVDAAPMRTPAVTVITEHYNRLVRLAEADAAPRVRLDVAAAFHDNAGKAFNTVAELPGNKKKGELVVVGAHLDSYHAGNGAVDNAAGVAVVMEAVRILQKLNVKPQRTIRVCLWAGEEQGLLGSKAYVSQHFASRPAWPDSERTLPVSLRSNPGPLRFTAAHAKVSAYFNLDNGSGKIRGIYLEENAAVRPVFEAWLAPFADLGVTTVTLNRTGGTDHMSFDRVGIPGFQFIQDPMNYMPQMHHTHLDTYDHLHADDLRQAAAVMASVLIHAANREGMLPRKPAPVDRPAED